MKTDVSQRKPQDVPGSHQIPGDQDSAHRLRDECGYGCAHDAHVKPDDKQAVQYDIDDAADDQIVQRPL